MVNIKPTYQALFLLMTNRCNLICKHCCVWSEPKGHKGMTTDEAISVINQTQTIIGNHKFILSGGEPLLRANDAISILKHSLSLGNNTLLLTNGMLINDRIAAELSSLANLRIRVSLDGASKENHDYIRGAGSYEKTLKGIDRLINNGYNTELLEIGCTITPGKEYEMDDILKLAFEKGIKIVKLKAISKLGRAIDFWKNIPNTTPDIDTEGYRNRLLNGFDEENEKSWYIEDIDDTSFKELNVYYDGSVYAYSFIGDKDQENAYLGNIFNDSLNELLNSDKLSLSITRKFLQFSIGPSRSLRSVNVFRK